MPSQQELYERMKKHIEAQANKKSSDITIQQATPQELATAVISPGTLDCFVSAALISGNPLQAAVFTAPPSIQGFPTNGNSFIVLSNGNAAVAGNGPACDNNADTDFAIGPIPPENPLGDPSGAANAYDVVALRLVFQLPQNPGSLLFDWKLASEEGFPSQYDYFRANVTTTSSPTPVNIALFPGGFIVNTTNAAAVPFLNCLAGDPLPDIIYDRIVTNVYTASYDLSAFAGQALTLDLIVGDTFDHIVDTAAFIDNIRITGCESRGISLNQMSVN